MSERASERERQNEGERGKGRRKSQRRRRRRKDRDREKVYTAMMAQSQIYYTHAKYGNRKCCRQLIKFIRSVLACAYFMQFTTYCKENGVKTEIQYYMHYILALYVLLYKYGGSHRHRYQAATYAGIFSDHPQISTKISHKNHEFTSINV